uniref:Uncharacterized protein n=1 Tax=Anguilla anguilla TaxID=7936 RepID=A0A0E9QMG2_ANGAN
MKQQTAAPSYCSEQTLYSYHQFAAGEIPEELLTTTIFFSQEATDY